MRQTRIRGEGRSLPEAWPIGEVPDEVIFFLAEAFVFGRAVGIAKISGDRFADAFAAAIGGKHLARPLGLADVVSEKHDTAWSVKTVKASDPWTTRRVRLISGRNSPTYSQKIDHPYDDIKLTGRAVLDIWNQRLAQTREKYSDLRSLVMVRNEDRLRFNVFEASLPPFPATEYRWRINKNRNLEAIEITSERHAFTWQTHGAQFTVIRDVPASCRRFAIDRPVPTLTREGVLDAIDYDDDWVTLA